MRKLLVCLFTIFFMFLYACGPDDQQGANMSTVSETIEETTVSPPVETQAVSYRDPEMKYLFFDDCNSLEDEKWVLSGVSDQVIIADSSDQYQNISVEPGTFGIYADRETGTYASMSKNIAIGDGPWTFEIRMDVKDLLNPSSNKEWRGLILDIFANSKRYYIALNGDGYIYAQQGNSNTQKTSQSRGIKRI